MSLQLSPASFKELNLLITQFNLVPEQDAVQRIFYLQKINAELNRTELNDALFNWLYDTTKEAWHSNLNFYGINPDAAFYLKNIQFAQAVKKHSSSESKKPKHKSEYEILQQRDLLLAKESFEEVREEYSALCCELINLVNKNEHLISQIKKKEQILEESKAKFAAIREQDTEHSTPSHVRYKTQELGTHVNNFNFKFTMTGWDKPFVFRVEDRDNMDLEQQLYSYPVSKYFAEDFGFFMWGFLNENKNIEYKPVFLCQYAEQGNLTEVAKSLRNTNPKNFTGITTHYFNQLTNLCKELIDAKVYHPDIKLTNFLVHGNRLIISDRKTLINTQDCKAGTIRSTPRYAPQEYVDCITPYYTFNVKGFLTSINMPQFMAYQLGMALKEFLILTQQDEVDYDEFREHSQTAADYFTNPDRSIVNLSALINELTREDASKRMSITQMQQLLHYRNHPTPIFYQEIEKLLPASALGIQKEVDEINDLLKSKLKGLDLIKKANAIFNKLNESELPEPRLLYLAEQLAAQCFKEGSYSYFSNLSNKIENALLDKDWERAPWYRKMFHVVSFGYFRVARQSTIESINVDLDFKGEEFKTHFAQLEHISHAEFNALGKVQARNFEAFIFTNLEKIRAEETKKEEEKIKAAKAQVVVGAADPKQALADELDSSEQLDTGTVVVTDPSTIVITDPGTVVITNNEPEKVQDHKAPKKLDKGAGPVINKPAKEDEKPDVAANQHAFFTKANRRTIFKTYRTTMFRGDGTLPGHKHEKPRPSVKEIFEPIIPEFTAEPSSASPSL